MPAPIEPNIDLKTQPYRPPTDTPYLAPPLDASVNAIDALSLDQSRVTVEEINDMAAASPLREYIAGGDSNIISPLLLRSLPSQFDDITSDFGDDIYEQMMRDPAVKSSIETLKHLTLSEAVRVLPAVEEADAPGYSKAVEYSDFISYCFDDANVDRPITQVLDEMLDALWRGSYIAEVVMKDQATGKYKGKMTLKKLATKVPTRYWFVVDRFNNVMGVVRRYALDVDFTQMTFNGMSLIPRDHLAILTFWGSGGDPRGSSILRCVYNAWYLRQQGWSPYLKWLCQWSTPSIIGTTPDGAPSQIPVINAAGQQVLNDDGTPKMISPERSLLNSLIEFQSGTAMAVMGGTKIEKIQSEGTGQAFTETFDMLRREIVLGILRVTRVTLEAKHGSKADSSDAHDILSIFCDWIRQHLVHMLVRDIVKPLMVNNFGEDSLDLIPKITLAGIEKADVAKLADAVAKLFAAGYFHTSQIQGLDDMLNFPERDMEAQLRDEQDKADQERMATMAQTRLMNPTAGLQDGPGGNQDASLGPPGSAARLAAANDKLEGVRKPGS